MKVTPAALADVLIFEPAVLPDERGLFFESYNERAFAKVLGEGRRFVQDNHSVSMRHVVRGLHYQIRQPQAKLVRVTHGEIFDVSVDLRKASPTFGKWAGVRVSSENRRQVWIPEGFAHGFLVLSERADVLYKTTDYYAPAEERTLLWNDPALGIDWPVSGDVILSAKDAVGTPFRDADVYA
jgi:dTDP-4-dehydrorhamnose 3,5-epimerase